MVWKDLNPEQSETLKNAPTLKHVKGILVEIFNLSNYSTQHREKILLNLYTYTIQFAREETFSAEQLSAYFSIVKQIHEICVESPFGNLDETFTYFKDLLMCHCVCRPPYSTELFSIKEVRKISYHVINTYFRHFKLYKYAFTPQMQLDLALNYIGESESTTSQERETESEKEKKEKSEIEASQVTLDGSDREMNLAMVSEKEEAKKYLRNLITEFLHEKINELKLSVKETLKQSEQVLNNKLEDAGYHEFGKRSSKKYGKCGKKII